ncbi:ECF transporter S component [Anaerobium acetethylicum]|uniref:Riboflavin transporter n=1 Tax=Anaerobium acetethylicum TaxID=1619234 RepID=A0A1D3TXF9_9FIRM|nr:ECF transporter S component [Anaerobium acetethylicum]SCP99003.1 Riboflavin transporter FmnP [Anaerobium acetethylicum]
MSSNSNVLQQTKNIFGVKEIAKIGMLSAIAVILMLFEIPLWFAPGFYKIDLSEVPVLIGTFAMGPLAGIFIEIIKILLNLLIDGTVTIGIGEFANLMIGCAIIVPSGLVYKKIRTRKGALIGMAIGTVVMTVVGCLLNAYVLLPWYAGFMEGGLDALIKMGTAVNPAITSLSTFVLLVVAPFNLLKGIIVSAVTLLLYKKISPVFSRRNG